MRKAPRFPYAHQPGGVDRMDGIMVTIRVHAFHRRSAEHDSGTVTYPLLPRSERAVELTGTAPWKEPWHGINALREIAHEGLDRALEDYDREAQKFASKEEE